MLQSPFVFPSATVNCKNHGNLYTMRSLLLYRFWYRDKSSQTPPRNLTKAQEIIVPAKSLKTWKLITLGKKFGISRLEKAWYRVRWFFFSRFLRRRKTTLTPEGWGKEKKNQERKNMWSLSSGLPPLSFPKFSRESTPSVMPERFYRESKYF